ncbi:MAG: 4-alpha-glucanotransferase [Muribaculaceae bacterium]
MRITLTINYRTKWGESVFVTGNIDALGNGSIEKAMRLEPSYDSNWIAKFEADDIRDLEYAYLIKTENGIVLRREWGKKHRVNSLVDANNVHVYDSWQDLPDDAQFYSTAFTKGIFSRKPEKADVNAGAGDIVLCVDAPMVKSDEVLAIVGETPELGSWDVSKALIMNGKDFPKWTVAMKQSPDAVEYKFVLLNAKTHGLVAWENGNNRLLEYDELSDGVIVASGLHFRNSAELWRGAGTAIPVFSLRSNDDYGVGDFYDLFKLIDWAEATGQKIIQLLPINDTTMTKKWTDSYPYNANSTFALHPMYIRPDAIGQLADKSKEEQFKKRAKMLNNLDVVDYEAATELKESYTKALYAELGEKVSKTIAFRTFVKDNLLWLKPYAAYSVLRDEFKTPDFKHWGGYATYNEEAIEDYVAQHKEQIGYIYFIQYYLDKQLREVRNYAHQHHVVLKGDIPIGISAVSVDAWLYPHLFHMDCQAGAPPDDFSIMGQNWGFPTYNWEVMQLDGYKWWKNRFRKMAEYFDAYRIDHILGFFRIWQIPTESVHGLLGMFYPALPYTADEMRYNYDFWMNKERFTKPFIHESFLGEYFGEYTPEVKDRFLIGRGDYRYDLQDFVSTQRGVNEYFEQFPQDEKNNTIKDGLLRLIDEVLFVIDKTDGNKYHPRISAQSTHIYAWLNDYEKNCFNRLYEDFFYHRHNDFWGENALRKLPALTGSTEMLVCGEDLGMIPACVADVMNSQKYLSLEIPRMPKQVGIEFGDTYSYPYLSVATTSTHDMSGIRAWWEEDHAATTRYYNHVLWHEGDAPVAATPQLCEEMLNKCLAAPSILCILPLQDWMAMDGDIRRDNPQDERINIPAVSRHYWRYRMHISLEQLLSSNEFNAKVKDAILSAGR